jgi:hypothetical protein
MQTIASSQDLEAYIKNIRIRFEKDKIIKVDAKSGKTRTLTQNASLHKFCSLLAQAMNEAGFDFRVFIKEGYPVPFTEELVKEYIWKPIQKAVTGHESTTKPEPKQYSEIYDVLNLKLAEHGLYIPWPCRSNM